MTTQPLTYSRVPRTRRSASEGAAGFSRHAASGLSGSSGDVSAEADTPVAASAITETVTDYCRGIIYEDGEISRINLYGGYLSYTDPAGNRLTEPQYHFYLHDHLGNNRADVSASGLVCQQTDYYPYGLPMSSSANTSYQRWLFGGKEMDRISGLDLYDQEARAYDPALGRFRSVDALAEKYTGHTPYLFCAANPLRNIDPTGNDIYEVNSKGEFILIEKTNNLSDKIISSERGKTNSITVEKSFMASQKAVNGTLDSETYGKKDNATVKTYQTEGNNLPVYDFLIGNTDVEWSHMEMKDTDGNRKDFIGTTNERSVDGSQSELLSVAKDCNLEIITVRHNHELGNRTVSPGDVKIAKEIQAYSPNAQFYIVFPNNQDDPVKYNQNTPPSILPEITVYSNSK